MKKILKLVYVCAVLFFLASCDDENEIIPTTGNLTIDLTGLEELGTDYVYEGWLIVNGTPVSTGTFTSIVFPQTFTVGIDNLNTATQFVLSIEPEGETGTAAATPAATKLLAGDFSGNSANVTSTGIVGDFSNSWGKYILATPTDDDNSNEESGIWFLDNSSGNAEVGLSLPTLTDGWKYEGWVVLNGTPVSTGTFLDPASADDNAATSPYKGSLNNGPAFPGEDYVMGSAAGVDFPTDLKDATIVISVEPYPDNSAAPFTLKPLANVVPASAMNHSVLSLEAGPISVLTGTVSR
ncbi:hypothetical protein BW723_13425 [Polaribacter reichenbachii]|uniref:Anti-sigma K factor RskA C-terminal domain-containing protein n=1 Tax=Polaribacter reichenbachii TaxID=996801 RepID=A0A1B8U198_9FLAO|nr:anti-sigma factor [Polaribacter reichenbachii]APZ47221.1 hypothetical protein BW723_13425 [Polaribacter reichenbachii]AUC17862.1 hypothetical protein BTO17_03880 [Polaribacter reichenbachii]OBY65647.1 hypothetical protein LPB301_08355 [Polaribacter reichenbachii]